MGGSVVKNLLAVQEPQEIRVRSLDLEDPAKEGMATHSSILAWRIPMDRGAWWATVHWVAKSQTRLKQLSKQAHNKFHQGMAKFLLKNFQWRQHPGPWGLIDKGEEHVGSLLLGKGKMGLPELLSHFCLSCSKYSVSLEAGTIGNSFCYLIFPKLTPWFTDYSLSVCGGFKTAKDYSALLSVRDGGLCPFFWGLAGLYDCCN